MSPAQSPGWTACRRARWSASSSCARWPLGRSPPSRSAATGVDRPRPDRTTAMSRFPFPDFPTGWFHVAYSRDVPPGSVVPLQYFGQELICYRGESGRAQVMDAFCPHLGAHIGYGGRVQGDDVVCPFHCWRFDTDGRNVEIPYRDAVNRGARLRPWPTREVAGMVFAWHDLAGGSPSWELPQVPEAADEHFVWHAPEGARWRIRSHPQEVLENTVDIAHFKYVHGVHGFGA